MSSSSLSASASVNFAQLEDDLAQGSGRLLCGILIDRLPDLGETSQRGISFDLILMSAV